jgi:hypothetical protein
MDAVAVPAAGELVPELHDQAGPGMLGVVGREAAPEAAEHVVVDARGQLQPRLRAGAPFVRRFVGDDRDRVDHRGAGQARVGPDLLRDRRAARPGQRSVPRVGVLARPAGDQVPARRDVVRMRREAHVDVGVAASPADGEPARVERLARVTHAAEPAMAADRAAAPSPDGRGGSGWVPGAAVHAAAPPVGGGRPAGRIGRGPRAVSTPPGSVAPGPRVGGGLPPLARRPLRPTCGSPAGILARAAAPFAGCGRLSVRLP